MVGMVVWFWSGEITQIRGGWDGHMLFWSGGGVGEFCGVIVLNQISPTTILLINLSFVSPNFHFHFLFLLFIQ
jgi:hypothetical protein